MSVTSATQIQSEGKKTVQKEHVATGK